MRAPRLRLGTVLEEIFLDRPVAVHGRVMHWAHAISVARVDIGVCCYQQANDTAVTALDRRVKRCDNAHVRTSERAQVMQRCAAWA